MTHTRTPKAVKAWAIVTPKGEIIEISLVHDIHLYQSAYFNDKFQYIKEPIPEEYYHLTLKEVVLKEGYRCIPIRITPL